jgi:hypothetical protein
MTVPMRAQVRHIIICTQKMRIICLFVPFSIVDILYLELALFIMTLV